MKKLFIFVLFLVSVCTMAAFGPVAADAGMPVNADGGIEIDFTAAGAGEVVIASGKDGDGITVKVNGDAQYEVYYAANSNAPVKADEYFEVATAMIGEHKINVHRDGDVYVVFVDGVMSAPYMGENYREIDLSEVSVTSSGAVTVDAVREGVSAENELGGLMTTAVNGEMDLVRNTDGSIGVEVADKRYTNGSAGDAYGQIGARNRVVVTEGFDVTKPIVFYAKASHDVYGFGFGTSKYDLRFTESTDTSPLGIQAFIAGGITYITEPNHVGESPNCAYRQGTSNSLDKFVVEIGEENTKITINDASFWGIYENVRWKRSDFPGGKAYLMFSFFSNGTTQGTTQELRVSTAEPMECEDSIKNYYLGEATDLVWQYKQMPVDKVGLYFGETQLQSEDYSYDAEKQELTIRSACLERIFSGSAYQLQEIRVQDMTDGFLYANLKIMLKRPTELPADNDFADSEAAVKEAGFFSEPTNAFFVVAIGLSVLIAAGVLIFSYKKFWRKVK